MKTRLPETIFVARNLGHNEDETWLTGVVSAREAFESFADDETVAVYELKHYVRLVQPEIVVEVVKRKVQK